MPLELKNRCLWVLILKCQRFGLCVYVKCFKRVGPVNIQ